MRRNTRVLYRTPRASPHNMRSAFSIRSARAERSGAQRNSARHLSSRIIH